MSESNGAGFGFGASMEGRTLQGHYRIDKMIAQGGMAWLYRATHMILNETMAVKLLYPHLAEHPKIRARFIDEAKIQFRLKHPHIVQVTDVIQDHNLIGSVMEWVEGEDVKHYIQRRGEPLSLYEMWDICRPILDALHYAHSLGLVHRDIKPANILLHWEGAHMTPKLSDFGIAKVMSEAQEGRTATGATLGTMEYMAPEQIQDSKRVDIRADIYSVGVMLYQMATGCLPFRGGPEVLIYKQMYEDPQPPSTLVPQIHARLDNIILRCMHKSPAMRFQNCMELSFALSSLVTQGRQNDLAFKATLDMPIFAGHAGIKPTAENRPFVPLPTPDLSSIPVPDSALPSAEGAQGSQAEASLHTPASRTPSLHTPAPHTSVPHSLHPPDSSVRENNEVAKAPVPSHHQKATLFLSEASEGEQEAASSVGRSYFWPIVLLVLLLLGAGGWWLRQSRKTPSETQRGMLAGQGALHKVAPRRQTPIQRRVALATNSGTTCQEGQRQPCYTGPSQTLGQGPCRAGLKVCRNGRFGPCRGEVKPASLELCNDRDDDCNGSVDETFARKGRSCVQRVGACVFLGTWQCHANRKSLRCRSQGRLRNTQATPVRLLLRPRGQRFTLKFGTRRIRVRNATCLEVTSHTVVSVEAKGYQLCTFSLPPRRRTLRLRLKPKSLLEDPPGYCLYR